MVFWCFPGAEKGCIGNKWVNMSFLHLTESINLKNHNTNFLLNFRYIFIFRWNLYKADIICYINKYFIGECFVCYEIFGRGFLPPPHYILRRPPHPLPTPHFWDFAQTLSSHRLHPHCSFCCLISLAEWVITPFYAPLNDIMDLYMSNLDILVPKHHWYVFYATRRQVYWGLTHMVFCWYSDLISHTRTHAHTKTYSTLRGQ